LWPIPEFLALTVFSSFSFISLIPFIYSCVSLELTCLSRVVSNSNLYPSNLCSTLSFIFPYLGSYGCTAKETLAAAFPDSILSVTAGNNLVPKEVSVCYCGHMLQQAGYQEVPY
jgi:hypothetical protein